MFRIPRQSYTEEFKREAVKLVESGMKPSEVSRQLGISEQTLGNWRKAKAAGKLAGNGKVVTPAQMELSRLRAEVIRLKAENEILKKAAADSIGRCNTFCFNSNQEVLRDGKNGATGIIRSAESRVMGALATGAIAQ